MKQIPYLLAFIYVLVTPFSLFSQDFNIELRSTLSYPGQSLNNICGYAQGGREYALVGASKGLSIVDVTNPDSPVEIVQIPGPGNSGKEIKVYSHYAYVVSPGGGGVQIVDLQDLPSPTLNYHHYRGSGEINGQLDKIHALHIDVTKGFLYVFGATFFPTSVHTLNPDPYNPELVGFFDQLGYVHDGYADNDTLYSCHVGAGILAIVNMKDKLNPVLLGTVETPGRFTHNAWLLDDHKHILTTDETYPSFLTCYDISDPSDLKELDRISTNDGNQSIVHNTHVLRDWAVTAWYTDGVVIVDAHEPDNLVIVGSYDTWPTQEPDSGFKGCWGVFPFLPSGNLVASNIYHFDEGGGKLFVLTPTYKRAAYLEGQVLDACTGHPVKGVTVQIKNSNSPLSSSQSDNNGIFKTGLAESGIFNVTISKPGYATQSMEANLMAGEITILNTALSRSSAAYNVSGKLLDQNTGMALPNTEFILKSDLITYKVQTNSVGQFDLSCIFGGAYRAGTWAYLVADVLIDKDGLINIPLQPGYYDDFELDLGWVVSGNTTYGTWELGEPMATTSFGGINPDLDIDTDNGDQCYITGNQGVSSGAVHISSTTLSAPNMKLAALDKAVLTFNYWFQTNNSGTNFDHTYLEVVVNNGSKSASVFRNYESSNYQWKFSGAIQLDQYLPLTDNMSVKFIVNESAGLYIEAALDVFEVRSGLVAASEPYQNAQLILSPNPTTSDFQLQYNWPDAQQLTLEVFNLLGQGVFSRQLDKESSAVRFGGQLPIGVYLLRLRTEEGRQSKVIKAVK